LAAAARIVLRDWSIGKFDRYTTPPAPVIKTAPAQSESSITAKLADPCDNITQLYANDEAILSTIRTRKERRKQGGLVKFTYGSIDSRKVAVEELWSGLEQNDDEESHDDDDEVDDEGMHVDGEDEDEENEDEEDEEEDEKESEAEKEGSSEGDDDDDSEDADQDDEIELPRLSHKQKRKRGPERSMPSPPAKKVSFGVMPPASTRGPKFDRQKIGRLTTKGKDKLKEKTRSKSNLTAATLANPAHKTSEKKGKTPIANVTAKIKAKGSLTLAQQSKDKSEPEVYDFGKFF
jgi:nuclear GTP-binding protein